MHTGFERLLKEVQFYSPLRRYFFPRYQYNFTPAQLCILCQCIEETQHVDGSIVEIGCAGGATTVFLNKHMDASGIEKPYIAVDTFSGFVAEDIDHEVNKRAKRRGSAYFSAFRLNDKKWFDATMRMNGVTRVKSVQADVNQYDLRALAPLSFVLFDVDFFRPTEKGLPELFDALAPGGLIVVDDCDSSHEHWDGAAQAYTEFVNARGINKEIVLGKLGILRKR